MTEIKSGHAIAADQFDVSFPEGCIVADPRNGKHYRIKGDGSMRELTVTGDELSEWEYQLGTPWYRRNRWLMSASGIVLLVLLTSYVIRRRAKSKEK